jgi:zona occludens toxin
MSIKFVTGLPRAGKTLWTLCHVREIAEKEKRQVYTCNIPGVTIPGWLQIDTPDKWMEVPDGSIIICDELQDFWGLNSVGSKVPLQILELSKHGKRGIDFWFITQEPELVHRTPRALCEHHYYVIRAFGSNSAMIYKFDRMQAHPEKCKNKGEKFPWLYKKEAYGWYTSADVHNVKRKIPAKVIAIPFVMLMAGFAIWGAFKFFGGALDKAKHAPLAGAMAAPSPGMPGYIPAAQQNQKNAAMTLEQYAAAYTPRVPGLIHSSPVYDSLTAPKQVPLPAACMSSKSKGCHCYTQQGTPYATTDQICHDMIAGGMFIPFQEPPVTDREKMASQQYGGRQGQMPQPNNLPAGSGGYVSFPPTGSTPVKVGASFLPNTGSPYGRDITGTPVTLSDDAVQVFAAMHRASAGQPFRVE